MTNFFDETPEETKRRMQEEAKKWTPEAIKEHYGNLPAEGQPRLEGKIVSGVGSDFDRHARRLVGPSWDVPLTEAEIQELES
jgi:hypothetical protein